MALPAVDSDSRGEDEAKVVVSAGWGGVRACARVFIAGKQRLKGAPDRYSRALAVLKLWLAVRTGKWHSTGTRRVIGAMQDTRTATRKKEAE